MRSSDGASHRTVKGKPFTSDLSGQDFWTLIKAGYGPVSLVMGSCVYHIAQQGFLASMQTMGKNQELTVYTQGLSAAELAMERMQKEAEELPARGGLWACRYASSHRWGSHVIRFSPEVGTAVVKYAETKLTSQGLVLPLNRSRRRPN